mmetsp:Transcript_85547/g.276040  ORF Transcript_85547/g.276040 Transcript_85547/m.276040 type:complete len:116 (+) Transcript_85547:1092-1439(+)
MVCLPFYCDQYEWAASVCKYRKAGVMLDKVKSTEAQITAAVQRALTDESLRARALSCRDDIVRWGEGASDLLTGGMRPGDCVGVPLAAAVITGAVERRAVESLQGLGTKCGCTVQ